MKQADEQTPEDELERQAWAWLRRLHSGDVRQADAAAFKRWLAINPAHRAIFSASKKEWEALRPAAGVVLRSNSRIAAEHVQALYGPQRNRRVFLGAALSAAAVAGVVCVNLPLGLWPSLQELSADERTATGEQRTIALDSRVQVTLNTKTSARRQIVDGQTTGIELLAGEAAVDLFDPRMPFAVTAGAGRSLSQSGRFEVRYLNDEICVTCVEGTVRVEHASGVRLLRARQQLVYDRDSVSAVARVDAHDLSVWRRGELVFRQTPLAQVVGEINRYRPGRVVLMNAAAARQPVSGSFAIALLDVALEQLQRTFDLHARSLPGGLYVLS